MSEKKKKSHSRAPGMTQISISLPERLVDKVDRLAKFEKRSRSNFITYILENLQDLGKKEITHLKATEPKKPFISE